MILSDIRQYLLQRGHASLSDIATHFDSNPDAVRGMLETWIRKGKVRKRLANSDCGSSCCQCDAAAVEIYEWIDAQKVASEHPLPLPTFCKH
ncbi:FeoC-like transcriptional regulator [Solemya velesiana gill symbiont]|uniref:Sugar metabolism transcriptional regulator n=1 Tax=Solemya velesiana gill symbiont TaxID=1918948 RepID=A0A1T2KXL6_9GAMM|nr:FeoC-like transcriptional regulator [Solemya velesiana gill symbiont]OOZ37607.1 sugar metabolism transcriptional regulator [Solemya velesiana gill symbiont]